MTAILEKPAAADRDVEIVTFYVGDLLLGAEIQFVEEINRHVDLTPVPHAHPAICGVMNLRGDVVTVLDLRAILGSGRAPAAAKVCNVILNTGGQRTGLLVDRISEVVKARRSEIHAPPANLPQIHARFLQGVFKLEAELLAVLDIREVLDATTIPS